MGSHDFAINRRRFLRRHRRRRADDLAGLGVRAEQRRPPDANPGGRGRFHYGRPSQRGISDVSAARQRLEA